MMTVVTLFLLKAYFVLWAGTGTTSSSSLWFVGGWQQTLANKDVVQYRHQLVWSLFMIRSYQIITLIKKIKIKINR